MAWVARRFGAPARLADAFFDAVLFGWTFLVADFLAADFFAAGWFMVASRGSRGVGAS
jgi:hypothetical protein